MNPPLLRLYVSSLADSPWRALATPEFDGEQGTPVELHETANQQQQVEIRWYVERFLYFPEGGNVLRANAAQRILRNQASKLREMLLQSELCRNWLAHTQEIKQGTLELVIDNDNDSRALRLPWELIDVEADRLSPLHTFNISVNRRSSTGKDNTPARITGPIRILVVVCRPKSTTFLDPRATPQAIFQASYAMLGVRIDLVRPATFSAVLKCIEDAKAEGAPIHILHFDGHGTTVPSENHKGALCFETGEGEIDLVHADEFALRIARLRVAVVMLDACNTADDISGQDSVALALLREGIPAVIAMSYAAHFEMTQILVSTFYKELFAGHTVMESLLSARGAIYDRGDRRITMDFDSAVTSVWDWFIPQLYQTTSGVAFDLPLERVETPKVDARLVSEPCLPPPPQAGFQGRAEELHLLENMVRKYRLIALHGVAGVGKTALARDAAAWWVQTGLFDNVIWVPLNDVLISKESLVEAMQTSQQHMGVDEKFSSDAAVAGLCGRGRLLIVWDGFALPHESEKLADDIADLAISLTTSDSRIILTTRDPRPMPSLVVSIDRPNNDDAVRLLTALLQAQPKSFFAHLSSKDLRGFIREVVHQLDGHPLACELFVTALKTCGPQTDPRQAISLAARAVQEHQEVQNRSIRASLGPALAQLTPECLRVLSALVLMKGAGLEGIAIAASCLPQEQWERVRTEFERVGIIRVNDHILRPHPLLGEVITTKRTLETVRGFLSGTASLCSAYADSCCGYGDHAESSIDQGCVAAMRLSDVVINSAIELALENGNVGGAYVIGYPFRVFLEREGRREEAARITLSIYDAGQKANDLDPKVNPLLAHEAANALKTTDPLAAQTILLNLINDLEGLEGEEVEYDRQTALTLLKDVNGRVQQAAGADTHRSRNSLNEMSVGELVVIADQLLDAGSLDEAEQAITRAIDIERTGNNHSALARQLVLLGNIRVNQQRNSEAREIIVDALHHANQGKDQEAAATARLALAKVELATRKLEEAIGYAEEALKDFRSANDKRGQLVTLNVLGDCERQRGEYDRALIWFDEAVELAELRNELSTIALSRGNRALVLSDQADMNQSRDERQRLLNESLLEGQAVLTIWQRTDEQLNVALAHSNIANAQQQLGRVDQAEEHGLQSLDILEEMNHPHAISALLLLEKIAVAQNDRAKLARWQSRRVVHEAWRNGHEPEPRIPVESAQMLVAMAMEMRSPGFPVQYAFSNVGVNLDDLSAVEPGLTRNLLAIATHGASRPNIRVSSTYMPLLDWTWESLESES